MEELIFLEEASNTPRGKPITNGPGNYKIPCFSDVPLEFNVSLLKGSPNSRAIYSSRVSYNNIIESTLSISHKWKGVNRSPMICLHMY